MTSAQKRAGRSYGAGNVGAAVLAVSGFFLFSMRQTVTVPLTLGQSLGQFLLFGCGALWALTRLTGQRSRIRSRSLTIAVLLYLVASLMSYALAMGRGVPPSVLQFGDRSIFTILTLGLMAFAISPWSDLPPALRWFSRVCWSAARSVRSSRSSSVVTGIDLAPQFRLPGLKASDFVLVTNLAREGINRPQGSAGHPLELGAVMTVMVPLGVGIIASARAKSEKAWPWILCTAILVCGAVVTVSRSALIGLAASVVVMAWRWPIQRLGATIAGAIAAVGLGWLLQLQVVTAFAGSFANLSNDSSIASRAAGAAWVSAHYGEHFWFGVGGSLHQAPLLDNDYLSRLMETGVLGLIAYVVLLGVALVLALRASAAASTVTAELAGAISGSLAAFIVIGTILDVAGFVQITYLAWFLIGLSAVVFHLSRPVDPVAHTSGRPQSRSNVIGSIGSRTGRSAIDGGPMAGSEVTRTTTQWRTVSKFYGPPPSLGWLLAPLLVPLLLAAIGYSARDRSNKDIDVTLPSVNSSVTSTMTTVTGPNVNVPAMSFAPLSISRNGNDFTLSGDLPDAAAKASLLDALKGAWGAMSISSTTSTYKRALTRQLPGIGAVFKAAAAIPDVNFNLDGDTITLTGTASSEDEKAAVDAAARAAWPKLKISNDIQVEAPTGAPGSRSGPSARTDCRVRQSPGGYQWPATDADQLRHRRVHADGGYATDVDSGGRQAEGLPRVSRRGQWLYRRHRQ